MTEFLDDINNLYRSKEGVYYPLNYFTPPLIISTSFSISKDKEYRINRILFTEKIAKVLIKDLDSAGLFSNNTLS